MWQSGKEFETYARVVVNAAGPFCDAVRKMVDKDAKPMICPSSGVHIVLPSYYFPERMGLIVPKTKDGHVVFMLPWLGRTVAGTTDSNTVITQLPEPHKEEIQFILDAISDYLTLKLQFPQQRTQRASLEIMLFVKNILSWSRKWVENGPLTEEDAVDATIKSGKLTPTNGSLTHNLRLLGYYEPAVDFIARRSRLAFLGTDAAGKDFETYAKVVVNAAGPFCDAVRKMVDKDAKQMICRSRGVHIVLPDYYPPEGMGLIVPKTKDGRVVFMLPWLGRTVAGTPDSNTIITQLPEPHEDEIILQLMSVIF
ncbi:hypothetical protein Tsubulata_044457 [Turnera subulata]|uniref:glycerol-3-phosphate dehydrogenase n=1 Tax=Turnera subulata TaxID=218843 RepID=A0A9Q0JHW8_9ROSI|nr:hypothetical protein Tsubulata_044457 [Turnera subulata]